MLSDGPYDSGLARIVGSLARVKLVCGAVLKRGIIKLVSGGFR